MLDRDDLDLVAIATRHDTHAELAAAGARGRAAVYVEKPLGARLERARRGPRRPGGAGAPLFVGFNRRYAPLAGELRGLPGRA